MVDLARRQDVLVDVGQLVGAEDDAYLLLLEGVVEGLQRVLVEIDVVGVHLHDEAAAAWVVGAEVPAAANAEVAAVGDDVDDALVGVFIDGLSGAVGGVAFGSVLNDEDVVGEGGLLRESAVEGVADGADTVAHGNHHRHLNGEVALCGVDGGELGLQVAANLLEVLGDGLLHLNL